MRFVGLSGIGWLIDLMVYTMLSYKTGIPFWSNIISSCIGTTFVFLFSTRAIFKHNKKMPIMVKYLIYIVYQIILIYLISRLLTMINSFMLLCFSGKMIMKFSLLIAKVIVTPVTMTLNFFVMKAIVENL